MYIKLSYESDSLSSTRHDSPLIYLLRNIPRVQYLVIFSNVEFHYNSMIRCGLRRLVSREQSPEPVTLGSAIY